MPLECNFYNRRRLVGTNQQQARDSLEFHFGKSNLLLHSPCIHLHSLFDSSAHGHQVSPLSQVKFRLILFSHSLSPSYFVLKPAIVYCTYSLGMKSDEMGLNPSLMWLRGDGGMQSLNQGMGVSPWMQPRFDPSMQSEIYQAMAAAAIQDMRVLDPSKQMLSSMMQFQQPQAVGTRPMQPQMLQQSHCSSPYVQNLQGNQSQAQSQSRHNLLQQQQFQQNSFNDIQIQQQQQQHVQNYSESQTMLSMPPMHQNFPESNVKGNMSSPLHSMLSSVSQDEGSTLLNVPRSGNLLSSSGWPTKRVAVDPLSLSSTSAASNAVSLPPFPGSRECLMEQEVNNDAHNNFLFGVNIDSSSLLMPNSMSNLKAVVSEGDDATMNFPSSSYMTSSAANYSLNPTGTSSSCIDESAFLISTDNGCQDNTPDRAFVKVICLCHFIRLFLCIQTISLYSIHVNISAGS